MNSTVLLALFALSCFLLPDAVASPHRKIRCFLGTREEQQISPPEFDFCQSHYTVDSVSLVGGLGHHPNSVLMADENFAAQTNGCQLDERYKDSIVFHCVCFTNECNPLFSLRTLIGSAYNYDVLSNGLVDRSEE